jgi:HK97 family phage portal protein
MRFFNKEKKENPIGASLLLLNNKLHKKQTNKKSLVEEGYMTNVVIYRAIREIVTGIADITIQVKRGDEIVDGHESVKILKRPNPTQGYDSFIKEAFTNYLLLGEMFVSRFPDTGKVTELWNLNPLNMDVKAGKGGLPSAYVHGDGRNKKEFPYNGAETQVYMMKTYNPLDYWRGLPPLTAAALAGDTHNAGMKWNYSLLKNSGRPSGIIELAEPSVSTNVANHIREHFKQYIQGEENTGEIPVLTGGAKWTQVDVSPRDMDFINTMKETAKYIATVFGVPLPLIDNDSSSYNNIEQAKERLWTDTIIPLFNEWLSDFGNWYLPFFEEGLEFCADLDSIPALEGIRQKKFERTIKAVEMGVISPDEARKDLGYAPVGGAAELLYLQMNKVPMELSGSENDEKLFNDLFEQKALSEKERTPPESAKNNAQKVLDWKKEHGDDVNGMTEVGWNRARQLAKGGALSEETIKKMAQFNRHRGNSKVADKHKGTPWKDAGYVAWLGWGGTSGIDWAIKKSEKIQENE